MDGQLRSRWAVYIVGLLAFLTSAERKVLADKVPCQIKSDSTTLQLYVTSGESVFPIRVDGVPLVTTLKADTADITVLAPLRFKSVMSLPHVPVTAARGLVLEDSRVTITNRTKINLSARQRDPSEPSIQLQFHQGLKWETPIHVPCLELLMDRPSMIGKNANATFAKKTGKWKSVLFAAGRFPLYAQPSEENPRWLSYHGPMRVLERRDISTEIAEADTRTTKRSKGVPWVHFQAKWNDGLSIQGWVPAQFLSDVNRSGYGISGSSRISHHCQSATSRHRFRLRSQAPIHAQPGETAWAVAANEMTVFVNPLVRADGWIQISKVGRLPNRCGHTRLWVHARDVMWQ